MGMFDSVMVACPKCGAFAEFQSKGGECKLETYTLVDAPVDVLSDIDKYPECCVKCGTVFGVKLTITTQIVVTPSVAEWKDIRDKEET